MCFIIWTYKQEDIFIIKIKKANNNYQLVRRKKRIKKKILAILSHKLTRIKFNFEIKWI